MLNNFMSYDFDDYLIEPATTTNIKSRKTINARYNNGYLPLFTAPMDTVISTENIHYFENNGILPIIPRTKINDINYFSSKHFLSYSLEEAEMIFLKNSPTFNEPVKVLIDVANGHMDSLISLSKELKKKYEDKMILMVGNIANPTTFDYYAKIGVDFVRIGVGAGGGCFIENSFVKTINGDKYIQDINIDDEVLTHTGEYKKVISTLQYPTKEELIKINDTISTKDHEYYVLHKKYENMVNDDNIHDFAEWIEAEKLTKDYFLLEIDVNV